ncbi:MAG: hypothetical protein ACD_57C00330G0001 [uncultured bacterium]|uniref:Uncharacterized protein n=1 Tax=Candidatus Curtissbacteria bacterium RIFOXYA1_FULL_41_14 TaxID=1797737 RepID=A0A1F5HB74_9BACT|nr:MAG: hypothetical protein ACD_57C00330G0001 [uncultured bacterium]KKR61258.1 MAG: hypothetical protein UU00_C0019G0011 [Microgenomates group bacterium GW2011_GWC1_40_35]KKS02061.1 MAG: hypothetical protein UU53_C0004G0009 [Candidatus Curtissbacteria bacterium GW2011_GWC2_41_21]OGE01330.1 MAG: hypothetical protein A2196_04220 [Candidatus Curtissbacteria bacterium RIFOXYA1_FULL_41_14]OGE08223.1 MAG: hypothetical protein A2615_00195 [Candidatus Curtissbacteria bacterium RIFOXYD1_FULL_41_36]OGE
MERETSNFTIITRNPVLAKWLLKKSGEQKLTDIRSRPFGDVTITPLPNGQLEISAPTQKAYSELLKQIREEGAISSEI